MVLIDMPETVILSPIRQPEKPAKNYESVFLRIFCLEFFLFWEFFLRNFFIGSAVPWVVYNNELERTTKSSTDTDGVEFFFLKKGSKMN
jgi:hypothetical protein